MVDEVAAFLGEYYRGFELADLNRMDAGMSGDFTATMLIPSRGDAPMHYDRTALLEGLRQAFEYYAGKQRPRMEIRDVRVLPRSRDEAVACISTRTGVSSMPRCRSPTCAGRTGAGSSTGCTRTSVAERVMSPA